ncbi:MAG TPA: polysaccharide deacetylase family protein [Flavobacteriales bacterium]|nr:polysaccharide deacetylase family protein [Flavobacteriales bacterium]
MIRVPNIVKRYYSDLIWKINTDRPELFLTFDDGPTPGVTEWVLDTLAAHKAKATFFCIGKNIVKHPDIYQRILDEGHSVGNHTFDHKKGWITGNFGYLRSVSRCGKYVKSDLFRPPYGRIKKAQINALKGKFRIVMWDVLSEDYKESIDAETCLNIVLSQSQNGSIIVFHDSLKAGDCVMKVLPSVLNHFEQKGFRFLNIT